MNNTQFKEVPDGYVLLQRHNGKASAAACLDGSRFHGWLFAKGPEGQWVSQRKLEPWEVMQAEDQRPPRRLQAVQKLRHGRPAVAQGIPRRAALS